MSLVIFRLGNLFKVIIKPFIKIINFIKLEHGCDYSNALTPRNSQLYSIEKHLDYHNKAFQNDFDNLNTKITMPGAETSNDHEDEVFFEETSNNLIESQEIRSCEFSVFTPQQGLTPDNIMNYIEIFDSKKSKNKKGFIDVYWTNDDGGLTLLLPYILSQNKRWTGRKLRIFTVVDPGVNYSQENLKKLLIQFRIPFSDVLVLKSSEAEPSKLRKQKFKSLIEKFMVEKRKDGESKLSITKEDLLKFKENTCRILKLKDMMLEHSEKSDMVVNTLPIVSKSSCPASLYLAWLDCLSQGMPPFVFVRGNQSNVLSIYA